MKRIYSRVSFATDNFLQNFHTLGWESFTGNVGSKDNIYTGVRITIIGKVMVGCMVGGNRDKIVIAEEVLEQEISLVSSSRNSGSIGVTSYMDDRVGILLGSIVNSIFKKSKFLNKVRFLAFSAQINIYVDAHLYPRLVKDHSEDTAGDRFKNSDMGIEFMLPHRNGATMSSGGTEREKVVMRIF